MSEEEKSNEQVQKMHKLSKEEKALTNIKEFIENDEIQSISVFDLKIALELIDRLQNELEEKTIILMAGAEKVKQLQKENEELNFKLKEKICIATHRQIQENFVSKDKIKDKIKEYYEKQVDDDVLTALEDLLKEN